MVDTVANLILHAGLPFRVAEDPAFITFCRELTQNPLLRLPSRGTVTKHADRMYEAYVAAAGARFRELVRPRFQIPGKVAATLDGWTSDNKEGFLIVTFHFITANGLESMIAACEPFPTPHTTESLLKHLVEIATRYGLHAVYDPANPEHALEDWCVSLTTDNASNVKSITEMTKTLWLRIMCACHTLQLVIRDVGKPGKEAKDGKPAKPAGPLYELIEPIHKLIVLFANATKRRAALAKEFKRLYPLKRLLRIIFPNTTRWNSEYLMVLRYCELYWAFAALPWKLLFDTEDEHKALFAQLKRVNADLPDLLHILEPFYDWTVKLSSSKKVTLSHLPEALQELLAATKPKATYSPIINKIAKGLNQSIQVRFDKTLHLDRKECRPMVLCRFFDVTSASIRKDHRIAPGAKATPATLAYIKMISASLAQDRPEDAVDSDGEEAGSSSDDGLPRPAKRIRSSFEDRLTTEISTYIKDDTKHAVEDTLAEWWQLPAIQEKYPILTWFALQYLSQQASEAAAERGASVAGRFYSELRQRMLANRAGAGVVLNAAARSAHSVERLPSVHHRAANAIAMLSHDPSAAPAAAAGAGGEEDEDEDEAMVACAAPAAADADDDIIDLDGVEEVDEGDEDEVLLQAGLKADEDGKLDTNEAAKLLARDMDEEEDADKALPADAVLLGPAVAQAVSNLRRSARNAERQDKLKKLLRH
jgi:hypothetical protein